MTATKKMTTLAIAFSLSVGIMLTGCSNAQNQDAVAYNNKLMMLMNHNQQDMSAMNAAMTSGDYNKAEKVRQDWVRHLNDAISKAEKTDDFKGSDNLKEAVVDGLKEYREMASENYKQLIAIRKNGDSTQAQKENKLLDEINKTFQEAGNEVNTANGDFQNKYAPE